MKVQEWLGHADPNYSLRAYVHGLSDDPGTADFMDGAVSIDGKVHHKSTNEPKRTGTDG